MRIIILFSLQSHNHTLHTYPTAVWGRLVVHHSIGEQVASSLLGICFSFLCHFTESTASAVPTEPRTHNGKYRRQVCLGGM